MVGYWRRRKLSSLAILAALMLLLRLGWGWWVGRQVAGILAEIRGRGEPVEAADVVYPVVPDSENAFVLQDQAINALVGGIDSPSNSNLEYAQYLPFPAEWMKLAEASEKAHGKAFALARQARSLPKARIPANPGTPFGMSNFRSLNGVKSLVNTIGDGADYSHVKGDDVEAIERLLDLQHIVRTLHQDRTLVSELVAMGSQSLLCYRAQLIAPGLRLDDSADSQTALRLRIKQLIDVLLDGQVEAESFRKTMMSERIFAIEVATKVATKEVSGRWMIRPLADRELIRQIDDCGLAITAATALNLSAAQRILPTESPRVVARTRYSRWFQIIPDRRSQIFLMRFRAIAERRMTAISLACQLYRADHRGWPERVEQLVPTYLPHLPADPFRDDGGPFGYLIVKKGLPDGGDRPLIFRDEGEADAPIPGEPSYGWYPSIPGKIPASLVPPRQYRDVSRFVPAPSKKTINNNPNKSDAPGEKSEEDDGSK